MCGLTIKGKTILKIKTPAETTINKINFSPDLILLTVKSYDTEKTMEQIKKITSKKTIVLSLQNGLGNIEKIQKQINKKQIFMGVTTHGAFMEKPGVIKHTGTGYTIIGSKKNTTKTKEIQEVFNNSGIQTTMTQDIVKEIWVKTIINSSINPLTAYFECKNGYLLRNPVLGKIVEKICYESTRVAKYEGIQVSYDDMIQKTKQVMQDTADNFSSMLQSLQKNKQTEIDSINGEIIQHGRKHNDEIFLNEILFKLIKEKKVFN
jgi:2-dehydropantoate 2-reductase